jgi:hypothetical protein
MRLSMHLKSLGGVPNLTRSTFQPVRELESTSELDKHTSGILLEGRPTARSFDCGAT